MIIRCRRDINGNLIPIHKLRALKSARRALCEACQIADIAWSDQQELLRALSIVDALIPEVESR